VISDLWADSLWTSWLVLFDEASFRLHGFHCRNPCSKQFRVASCQYLARTEALRSTTLEELNFTNSLMNLKVNPFPFELSDNTTALPGR
jgi:hypothetical protein